MEVQLSDFYWAIIAVSSVLLALGILFVALILQSQRRFITHQKEKLEELKKSEQKYSDLFHNVSDIVFLHSLDGFILQVNSSITKQLGYQIEEVTGQPLQLLFGKSAHRRIEEYLRTVKRAGEARGLMQIQDKYGRTQVFEYRNSLVKQNGLPVAVRGIARNITDQRLAEKVVKENEKRYRQLVEHSPVPMIVHVNGCIVYANKAALLLLKAGENATAVIGKLFLEFIHPDYCADEADLLRAVTDHNKAVPLHQGKVIQTDGSPIDVELSSIPIVLARKRVVQTVVRDITEAKRAEEALREIPKQIIGAQEAERKRVARELHDGVNQILASVQFTLHVKEQSLSPGERALWSDLFAIKDPIEKSIHEIQRISQNLMPSLLEDLGLVAAVRSMCDEFSQRTRIVIQIDLCIEPTHLPAEIELCLFRIIQEALNNIEKHSHATHVVIDCERDERSLTVIVKDDGIGFDQTSPKISRGGRSGVGLAAMKERAAFVGGVVMITSEREHGTTIAVKIPMAPIPDISHPRKVPAMSR